MKVKMSSHPETEWGLGAQKWPSSSAWGSKSHHNLKLTYVLYPPGLIEPQTNLCFAMSRSQYFLGALDIAATGATTWLITLSAHTDH
jgi:hypothetical protein